MLNKFVTVEGIEGAGKTTAIQFIQQWLMDKKLSYVLTREPGGTQIAEEIRHILLRHHEEKLNSVTEVLLFFAGRAQNIASTILPALASGKWVICDRFIDASFAYQGGGRELPLLFLECLEKYVLDGRQPNLTLLLDVPIDVGLSRINARGNHDRIEKEKERFFNNARQMYLKRAKQHAHRFRIINTDCSLKEMKKRLYQTLNDFFNQHNE